MAEGLLAYLDAEGQERLIRRVHGASAPGSRVALDRLLPADKEGEEALRRLSERSGMAMATMLQTAADFSAPQWLNEHGWSISEDSTDAVADRYGRDLADPFAEQADRVVPPWLATAFLCGCLGTLRAVESPVHPSRP